jgi:molecular chaperone DnaK (HSP70)
MKDFYIGIDLGSTKTAVARVSFSESGRRSITRLGGADGQAFSSMAALPRGEGGPPVFGREVQEGRVSLAATHEILPSLKEYLGMDASFEVGGRTLAPADLIGEYLKYVKRQVFEAHSLEITEAAFSIASDLSAMGREDLVEAARKADIAATCLVYAPTALYLATREQTKGHNRVLCLDCGGGESSIGIYESSAGEARELAVACERVGGFDADMELAARIHSKIAAAKPQLAGEGGFESLPAALGEELLAESEKAKILFSETQEDIPISIRNYRNASAVKVNITHRFFEEALAPLVYTHILPALNRALERAGVTSSGVDCVVVSGAFSALGMIGAALEAAFGEGKTVPAQHPDYALAYGAALADRLGQENCRLADDVCVSLSDGRLFAILEEGEEHAPTTEFALTQDAQEAGFHLSDSSGRMFYGTIWVETKGFLKESLLLRARLTRYKTVEVAVANPSISRGYEESMDLVNIPFKYRLKILEERQEA